MNLKLKIKLDQQKIVDQRINNINDLDNIFEDVKLKLRGRK